MNNLLLKNIALSLLLLTGLNAWSQPAEPRLTRSEYIERYRDLAIKEMLMYGIPASITIAQGILESGDGNSPLARYANNHFGIKCHVGWEGPSFIQDDDEKNECFRKYRSVADSYRDHSEFLRGRKWYQSLFDLKPNDYQGWAKGLKAAGYATHPKYAELLIELIERNKLYELDQGQVVARKEPSLEHSPKTVITIASRKVELINKVRYTVAGDGDNVMKLAEDFDMAAWQIEKYNDLEKGGKIKKGEIIYLQPKRKNASEKVHIVRIGDTMHSISQTYGIKLKHLCRHNALEPGADLKAGQKLLLQKEIEFDKAQ